MLWPEEFEAFRVEARGMVATARASLPSLELLAQTDQAAKVQAIREMHVQLDVASPDGADEVIGGVPCRVFRSEDPRGTYLHFHGGGMFCGSPLMQDIGNAEIARDHRVDVVSVGYRLAPEHPFPAGSDDCVAVAREVLQRSDGPVVVGGESAGGYYAALTALRIRDELGAIDRVTGANLVYGLYDLSGTPSSLVARPSAVDDFILELYLPGRSRLEARDPACSPLYADLDRLPPALFTVGTADGLLDDSLFMAARWEAYGNEAELAVYPDCIHGFDLFPIELAKIAKARRHEFLARCFTPRPEAAARLDAAVA